MINQTAKKILKALSFDGVEVEAFRHMADLKRLDPMKIFYKKIDEKIYHSDILCGIPVKKKDILHNPSDIFYLQMIYHSYFSMCQYFF